MDVKIDFKKLERAEKKARKAMRHGFTPKDMLKRAYIVLKNEDIDERDRLAVFTLIVSSVLPEDWRFLILREGHKEEVQEYFRKELGISWSPAYMTIDNGDGTFDDIKLMRYYLVDDPPSFL